MINSVSTDFIKELSSGNTVTYFTVGNSMKPLLFNRDTHVVIAPTENIKPNDILLYLRPDGSYVLHRLKAEKDGYYLMRGDNTFYLEKVERRQILGTVKTVFRKGKTIDVEKSKPYKLYVFIWKLIYPLRLIVHWLQVALQKGRRAIKKLI